MPAMSPMDRAFFLLETEQRPMNVGALLVLKPRHRNGHDPAEDLIRRMLRCPVGAPFSYRLAPTLVAGWPALVDDPNMDPAGQVHRHELPAGSDLQGLFAHVCELHSRRLERDRPLWEAHVFDGLEGGRIALYFKTHHGLIDGIGFIRIFLGSVSERPGTRKPQAIWSGLPQRPRAEKEIVSPVTKSWPAELVRGGFAAGRIATDLAKVLWHVGRRDLGLGPGLPTPFVTTPDVLKAPPSPHRVMAHCALPLERVRAVAKAAGAKVNDVLLATLDVAMSRYLEARGVRPARPLVADMPVALRDDGGAGNRVTILQVPMGRPGGTPAERLADVLRETRTIKDEVRAVGSDALFMYSIFEHAIASAIESLNLAELPMLANAVISNPAGLGTPVYFNGAAVELALPVSVVAHHQVLNVTITNYGPSLHVTFIALREALPDVQELADGTARALVDLEASVSQPHRAPKRRRRRPHARENERVQPTLH